MSMDGSKYDAFISYRHMPLDKAVAERLQKLLESFKPPKGVAYANTNAIKRIFRDESELPTSNDLGADIRTALEQSSYLVAVITPQFAESKWCMQEIFHFKELHGGRTNHILPLLTSGGPWAFPDALRYDVRTVALEDGGFQTIPVEVEPLASNVVAESPGKSLKKLKVEFLRIAAPILGCSFDELYGRYQRRARRRIAMTAAAIVVVAGIFAGSVLYQNSIIQKERDAAIANEQLAIANEKLAISNEQLAKANEDEANRQARSALRGQMELLCGLSKNAVNGGDRLAGMRDALEAAAIYDALYPEGDDEKSEEIRRALEGSVYRQSFSLLAPLENNSRKPGYMEFSPDDKYILGSMGDYEAALFDAYTGIKIASVTRSRPFMDNMLGFLSFSPSGEYFVTGFGMFTCDIIVWTTGAEPIEIASCYSDSNFVKGCFLSETELIFGRPGYGVSSTDDEVVIWNFITDTFSTPSKAQAGSFNNEPPPGAEGGPDSGALDSPDGGFVYVYNMGSGEHVRVYESATGLLAGEVAGMDVVLAFSNDGQRFVAANVTGHCGLFNTQADSTTVVYKNYTEPAYSYPLYFDVQYPGEVTLNSSLTDSPVALLNEPSGRFMAVWYESGYVVIWDFEKDETDASYIMLEHFGAISYAFMTSEYMITAGLDGRLIIFNLREGSLQTNITVENGVFGLNLTPDGCKAVAVGRSLKSAYVYDLSTGLQIYRIDSEPDDLIDHTAVGFSEDGRSVIVMQQSGRAIVGELFLTIDEMRAAAVRCTRTG